MVAVFCAARSAAGFGALLDMAVGGDLYWERRGCERKMDDGVAVSGSERREASIGAP